MASELVPAREAVRRTGLPSVAAAGPLVDLSSYVRELDEAERDAVAVADVKVIGFGTF